MNSLTARIRTSGPDSTLGYILLRNGGWLIVPPMLITFGLWGALPAAYDINNFWQGIPAWLGLLENSFRILVFALPGILYFGRKDAGQRAGWILYAAGIFIYSASYLAQITFPDSIWSRSLLGFAAPAWTTSLWLAGIGLVSACSWLPIRWHRAIYLGVASLFLICHVGHTILVYSHIAR